MAFVGNTITESKDTGGAVARTVDQAQSSAHKVIDQASGAARPAVDRFAAGAHQAVDKLAGAANQTAEAFDVKSGQLRDAHSRMSESCRGYVRDQPLAVAGCPLPHERELPRVCPRPTAHLARHCRRGRISAELVADSAIVG